MRLKEKNLFGGVLRKAIVCYPVLPAVEAPSLLPLGYLHLPPHRLVAVALSRLRLWASQSFLLRVFLLGVGAAVPRMLHFLLFTIKQQRISPLRPQKWHLFGILSPRFAFICN